MINSIINICEKQYCIDHHECASYSSVEVFSMAIVDVPLQHFFYYGTILQTYGQILMVCKLFINYFD